MKEMEFIRYGWWLLIIGTLAGCVIGLFWDPFASVEINYDSAGAAIFISHPWWKAAVFIAAWGFMATCACTRIWEMELKELMTSNRSL